MVTHILNLWKDERGQDLVEYTILISFIAIAVVGLFIGPGKDVKNIWVISNNQLNQANTTVS